MFRGLHYALLSFAYASGSSVNMGYGDGGEIILTVPRVPGAYAKGRSWDEALAIMAVNLKHIVDLYNY